MREFCIAKFGFNVLDHDLLDLWRVGVSGLSGGRMCACNCVIWHGCRGWR